MIPEEVAILGIGSEHLMSTVVSPTLSEVDLQSKRQGFLAAEMLGRLMSGKRLKRREVRLPPLGILAHESTDLRAIADPCLRKAISFIRTHVDRPLKVSDVLREVPLSRRGLERRFMAVLNRSPAAEIRRARLDKTRRLLAESNLPMSEVARSAGWSYAEHMIPTFKKAFHLTPLQYRKQVQARS
jgi:LacI family transcriptional regulator